MGYRNYSTAVAHIVDQSGHGDFTTIQSAIDVASAGATIYIMPGLYVEDITGKAGINLYSAIGNSINGSVSISGVFTLTSGQMVCEGINFTNANVDYSIVVSGSSVTTLDLFNSQVNLSTHTAINFSNSNSGSNIFFQSSLFSITSSNTIALYTMSSPGTLDMDYVRVLNQSGTTTASTNSAGVVNWRFSQSSSPLSSSSTGSTSILHSDISGAIINSTPLTTSGTGTHTLFMSTVAAGTASAVDVGAGTTVNMALCEVNSSNANAITGGGTLNAGIITFTGSSSTINTSTVNKYTTYGGTIV